MRSITIAVIRTIRGTERDTFCGNVFVKGSMTSTFRGTVRGATRRTVHGSASMMGSMTTTATDDSKFRCKLSASESRSGFVGTVTNFVDTVDAATISTSLS